MRNVLGLRHPSDIPVLHIARKACYTLSDHSSASLSILAEQVFAEHSVAAWSFSKRSIVELSYAERAVAAWSVAERSVAERSRSNHLGNVYAVISDGKLGVDDDNNNLVDYFEADVISAQDYYLVFTKSRCIGTFGSTMPGRTFEATVATTDNFDYKAFRYGLLQSFALGDEGWVAQSGASVAHDAANQRLEVTTDKAWEAAAYYYSTTIGKVYRIELDVNTGECGDMQIDIYTESPTTLLANYLHIPSGEQYYTFTATSATTRIKITRRDADVYGIEHFYVNRAQLIEVLTIETEDMNGLTKGYRYGFNGMEKDDELTGVGNSYTAEFWEYDSRLGRRWDRDPVIKAWQSSYATFDNNPIYFSDPSGAVAEGPPCEDCESRTLPEIVVTADRTPTFPEVVITAKAPKKNGNFLRAAGNFLGRAGDRLKEMTTITLIFITGALNAWSSNQIMGAGRGNPQDFGPYAITAQAGQTFGDVVSLATGTAEIILGGGEEVIGVTLDATGVGAVLGIPLNILGAATAIHGATVISTATANMIKDGVNRTHDNMHGNPSSGGSSQGKKPTPDTNPDDFTKMPGNQGYVHKKSGEIYKKSHTSHGNPNNTGNQWKVWPKGTKDFGSNSKKSGKRTTLDGEGNVIGN